VISPPLLWLGLACLLLIAVLIGADSDGLLLIGGLAALVLVLASGLLPVSVPLQLLLFGLLAAAGYGWLRASSRNRREAAIRPPAGAELAEVIEAFDSRGEGRVRWQGQSWAAQNMDPQLRSLPPGSRVTVLGREGTRLQVLAQP
jgi:membrane protein implicated in regulation of membrane protease activity